MKFTDKFFPNFSLGLKTKNLVSTYIQKRELPTIEMKFSADEISAIVKFNFIYIRKNTAENKMQAEHYTRIIQGPSKEVYKVSTKQSSRIGLNLERQFNKLWQSTLMELLNKPSNNRTILNLGRYKKDGYGIYDLNDPSELLQRKLISSGMKQKDLASLAGVDETTLYRHLKGTFEISRDSAVKYAKALGCDPVEILFNNLNVPIWGTTNTLEMSMLDKFSVYASEITTLTETSKTGYSVAQCPREIYRPDIKAIKIKSESSVYNNYVAYYYNSTEPVIFEDEMVIVGTKIKNFSDKEVRLRYFIGIYKKNKNGKTVDLQSIDPDVINVEGVTPDEDFHTFDDVVGMVEQEKYVIEDITPEFVAPVVALVQNNKIYNPIRSEILKAYETIYTKNRKEEIATTEHFKKLKLQAALRGMVSDVNDHFDKDDWHETLTAKQIKAFIKTDKRFQSILSKAAYGPAKDEKRIKLQDQVRQLNIELNAEEEKIVQEAAEQLQDQFPEQPDIPPEEAGFKK